MSRPARPWFRFYTESFNDRKLLRLSPEQRWFWAAILGAARESPRPGFLLVADGVPMTEAELARYADVKVRVARDTIPTLFGLGMLSEEDGILKVCNWHARQFESDNVTARTHAHRERSKEHDGNVPTNVRGNTPDTETDTETDKRTPSAAADDSFARFYQVYPRRTGRGQAVKAWRSAVKKADASVIIEAASLFAEQTRGTEQRFIPHPATWLNGERWADEADEPEPEPEDRPWWAS